MMEALGVLVAHDRKLGKQVRRPQQQVVEVHGVILFQQFLITLIDALDHLIAVGLDGVIFRENQIVLGPRNGAMHRRRTISFIIQVQVTDGGLDHALLVVVIVDHEVGVEG